MTVLEREMAAILNGEEPFHRVRSEPAFSRSTVNARRGSVDTGVGSSRHSSSGASSAGSGSPPGGSVSSLVPVKTLSEKIQVSQPLRPSDSLCSYILFCSAATHARHAPVATCVYFTVGKISYDKCSLPASGAFAIGRKD